jgi:tartrate-resistant acid phosphatase type 5
MAYRALSLFIFIFAVSVFGVEPLKNTRSSFLVFGDFGTGTKDQYKVGASMQAFCESNPCDFSILVGDNFYPSGVRSTKDKTWKKAFEIPYAGLALQFFAVLGNHDYEGNIDAQIAYTKKQKRWVMSDRYWTFEKKNIQFFMLDTEGWDDEQAEWLEEELEGSRATWKIAVGHHPIYSYGEHGHTVVLQKKLLPIIKEKVDYYLCGHDHDMQYIEKKGLAFVVSGAAAKTRTAGEGAGTQFSSDELGFAYMQIDGDNSTLSFHDVSTDSLYKKERKRR